LSDPSIKETSLRENGRLIGLAATEAKR